MKPRLLDLFCGAGGAAMGYHRAGFEVVGVDINPQPHYPFDHVEWGMDALTYLDEFVDLDSYAAIHASPPCQAYSLAQRLQGNEHPDLVGPIRDRLRALDVPYVIENVVGAPLIDPVLLCGASFPELGVYRHRLFESNVAMPLFPHLGHGVKRGQAAMGIDWMTQGELAEAIPPAYTEWIGRQLILAAVGRDVA